MATKKVTKTKAKVNRPKKNSSRVKFNMEAEFETNFAKASFTVAFPYFLAMMLGTGGIMQGVTLYLNGNKVIPMTPETK